MVATRTPPGGRVILVGAGAVGSVIASALVERAEVLVADADPSVLAAYELRGVRTIDPFKELSRFPFRRSDVVVLATRAPEAAAAAAPIPPDVPCICVVDGFDEALGGDGSGFTVRGVVDFSAVAVAPGQARRIMPGTLTIPRRSPVNATQRLAAAMDPAIVRPRLTDDIVGHRWSKLLIKASLEPVAAIKGTGYSAVFGDVAALATSCALLREGVRVAGAAGVRLHPVHGVTPAGTAWVFGTPVVRAIASRFARRRARDVPCIMLDDLRRGVPTEIDALNGYIAGVGERLGVPAPAHRSIVETIRRLGAGARPTHAPPGGRLSERARAHAPRPPLQPTTPDPRAHRPD